MIDVKGRPIFPVNVCLNFTAEWALSELATFFMVFMSIRQILTCGPKHICFIWTAQCAPRVRKGPWSSSREWHKPDWKTSISNEEDRGNKFMQLCVTRKSIKWPIILVRNYGMHTGAGLIQKMLTRIHDVYGPVTGLLTACGQSWKGNSATGRGSLAREKNCARLI